MVRTQPRFDLRRDCRIFHARCRAECRKTYWKATYFMTELTGERAPLFRLPPSWSVRHRTHERLDVIAAAATVRRRRGGNPPASRCARSGRQRSRQRRREFLTRVPLQRSPPAGDASVQSALFWSPISMLCRTEPHTSSEQHARTEDCTSMPRPQSLIRRPRQGQSAIRGPKMRSSHRNTLAARPSRGVARGASRATVCARESTCPQHPRGESRGA